MAPIPARSMLLALTAIRKTLRYPILPYLTFRQITGAFRLAARQ
jgi:hypothetical protein